MQWRNEERRGKHLSFHVHFYTKSTRKELENQITLETSRQSQKEIKESGTMNESRNEINLSKLQENGKSREKNK